MKLTLVQRRGLQWLANCPDGKATEGRAEMRNALGGETTRNKLLDAGLVKYNRSVWNGETRRLITFGFYAITEAGRAALKE